jgi:hypothetical protein
MSDRMTGMRRSEPTGRYRFRLHRDWRGRQTMVLQMQWRGLRTIYLAGHPDTQWMTCWCDARLEDVEVVDALPAFRLTSTAADDNSKDRAQSAAPQSSLPQGG